MTGERIYLYDTTLRDGAQTQGVDFGIGDKLRIAAELDALGVDYIEGGWPGANPTDDGFFERPPELSRSRLCAFGMTRRAGRSAANDPGLAPHYQCSAPVITLVGKTSVRHANGALGVDLDENLRMIEDSLAECGKRGKEAIFDAEHFFDGYREDAAYAVACLEAALAGGARWLVLCDTNGGALPHEVQAAVEAVAARLPADRIGIHTHNDTENAVANTLAAVRAGAHHVQGTLNGLGERCGNANLVSLIPTLALKMGFDVGISDEAMSRLTPISRGFDEQLNRTPDRSAAYVGVNAFAHKGGLHASAVAKDPTYYEHIAPETVGNAREILVSDQAGRANLLARLAEFGLDIEPSKEQVSALLRTIKERESEGFAYEGAAASFELLVHRTIGDVPAYFELLSFRVIDERRFNARGELVTFSEATIKVDIGGTHFLKVADGNGPVNALDHALRQALVEIYPGLANVQLVDYKVRIMAPEAGTAAVTRVIIESTDESGRHWSTVGVSPNIIDASYNALFDSITHKLFADGVEAAH